MGKENPFPEGVVKNALLWCARHCCVCGEQCGVHIEMHHIDPKGKGDQDNCLPVCYNCHGMLSHYDPAHPRGRKFRPTELKIRREQVYEYRTRHLVPATKFEVLPHASGLPRVGFVAMNLRNYPPVRAKIEVSTIIDGKNCGVVRKLHYDGKTPVNLNPGHGFNGWVDLPEGSKDYKKQLLVRVLATIIDPYEREHPLLPFGFVHLRKTEDAQKEYWYYEPSPDSPEVICGARG